MAYVAYISRVKVEPVEGKTRRAHLPAEEEPVLFGVHDEVAEHYGVSPDAGEAAFLDAGLPGRCCRRLTARHFCRRAGGASSLLRQR